VAGPLEVAVVGAEADSARAALREVALRTPSPGAVVVVGEPDPMDVRHAADTADSADLPGTTDSDVSTPGTAGRNVSGSRRIPLLAHRGLVDGRAAAYVCRNFVCDRPLTDPAELAATIGVHNDESAGPDRTE